MSVRVFAQKLNTDALFRVQGQQYSERLLLSVTIPAGQTAMGRTVIGTLGHFLCQHITGHFDTMRLAGAPAVTVDDAVSHLRGMLMDSAGNRRLYNDYIPLDLLFSPGRRRNNTAVNVLTPAVGVADTAPVPFPLFYPTEFEYLFAANSEILFDVKNDSDVALTAELCFHGVRILSSTSVSGLRQ
jgi:hypothetical protein